MFLKKFRSPGCCRTAAVVSTLIASLVSVSVGEGGGGGKQKPNVLFIAIDDLNDWTGFLGGHPQAQTPNLDRLAEGGTVFTNAHCQSPSCGPSRTSLLTGMLPSNTGIYANKPWFRSVPELTGLESLPQFFSRHGYRTFGAGKIFHQGGKFQAGEFTDPGHRFGYGPMAEPRLGKQFGPKLQDWGAFPEKPSEHFDHKIASWTIQQLEATHEKPFFLAAGFYRPHVPLYAPPAHFAPFEGEAVELPPFLASDRDDLPEFAGIASFGFPAWRHAWVEQNGLWRELVAAYLACVHFVDAQIGRVISALEKSPYAENTVIVLWSDHGWHLGEKSRWGKMSLWEESTRVPLVFAGAGADRGQRCHRPVQLVDIFPTLATLCGLEKPGNLDGRDLTPLLADPSRDWPHPALTTYNRYNHSLRNEGWRYIRYADGSEELYDHRADPNEWHNLAAAPEHAGRLKGFRDQLPSTDTPAVPGTEGTASPGYAAPMWRWE